MKNCKNQKTKVGDPIRNPVAKFAYLFNKAHLFEDKNKYRRNAKHRKQEASPTALVRVIREAPCVLETVIRTQEIGNSLASDAGLMNRAIYITSL